MLTHLPLQCPRPLRLSVRAQLQRSVDEAREMGRRYAEQTEMRQVEEMGRWCEVVCGCLSTEVRRGVRASEEVGGCLTSKSSDETRLISHAISLTISDVIEWIRASRSGEVDGGGGEACG